MTINFGFDSLPPDLDNSSPSPESWLAAKRKADSRNGESFPCDASSNIWRLHDCLYDLTQFIDLHPGGRDWILLTRGTDITEMFESHHPNIEKARSYLKKYCLKKEISLPPRNSSTFSFEPNGFYCKLREKAWNDVLQHCGTGPSMGMLLLHSTLLASFLGLLLSSAYVSGRAYASDFESGLLKPRGDWLGLSAGAGVILAFLMMCSHNFFHQRDNWRMYAFDLSPFSSYDWRITHAYSHHTFPNTAYDYEVSTTANVLNFYPYEFPSMKIGSSDVKSPIVLHAKHIAQIIFIQIAFLLAMNISLARRVYLLLTGGAKFRMENLLPLLLYCALTFVYTLSHLLTYSNCINSLKDRDTATCLWNFDSKVTNFLEWQTFVMPFILLGICYALTSWTFLTVSLAAGHHHPDCWHDGDDFEISTLAKKKVMNKDGQRFNVDWGVFQLAAVGERPSIDSSMVLASVSFGRHALHHLFPTVDHSKLQLLVPCFKDICEKFNVRYFSKSTKYGKDVTVQRKEQPTERYRNFSVFDSWAGMWKQLWRCYPSNRNFVSAAMRVSEPLNVERESNTN